MKLITLSFLIQYSQSLISTNCNVRNLIPSALSASKETDAIGGDGAGNNINQKKYTTLPRIYVGPLPTSRNGEASSRVLELSQDFRLQLDSDQAHYVTKVMRIDGKKRSLLRLFDGQHGEWLARIDVEGTRNRITAYATCLEQLRFTASSSSAFPGPWLLFAPLQSKARAKWLLEKCTELGVSRFVPIQTERTLGANSMIRDMDKLALQLVEASEQCERLILPTLSQRLIDCSDDDDDDSSEDSLLKLKDVLHSWEKIQNNGGHDRQLLICRERSSVATPVLQHLMHGSSDCGEVQATVAFLVGPEGGWSVEEEQALDVAVASSSQIHAVSLGSNVLRAETAAMAAMTAFALWKDAALTPIITSE